MADDLDIYGDLCADMPLPSPSPVAISSPAPGPVAASAAPAASTLRSPPPQASPPSPPRFSPPSSSPPRASPVAAGGASSAGEGDGSSPGGEGGAAGAAKRGASSGAPQTWVAPGWEHLAGGSAASGPLIVEAGEVVSGGAGIGSSPSASSGAAGGEDAAAREMEALRAELAAEERPVPRSSPSVRGPTGPAASVIDIVDDDDDDTEDESGAAGGGGGVVSLGEVRASECGTRMPRLERVRWNEEQRAAEMARQVEGAAGSQASRSAPAPAPAPLPAGQVSPADCFLLVGGLPPSMPNPELRQHAEAFGQIRSMRVLEEPGKTRRSAGIVLFEYVSAECVRRAGAPGSGFGNLAAFLVMGVLPRVVLVGRELLNMMRAGDPPWPEGGPCSDDLRCVLNRQFEIWNLALRDSRSRAEEASPSRGSLRRRGSSGGFGGSCSTLSLEDGSSAGGEQRRGEGWEDKLKSLRKRVNSKSDLTAPPAKR